MSEKPKLKFNMKAHFDQKMKETGKLKLTKQDDPQKEREKEIRIVPTTQIDEGINEIREKQDIEENVFEEEEKVLAEEEKAPPKIILKEKPKKPTQERLKITKPKHKLSLAEMIDKELPDVKPILAEQVKEQIFWIIEGGKSASKTSTALSFEGKKKVVLAFDKKTGVIWKEMYQNDPGILIYDSSILVKKDDELTYLQTSTMAVAYIMKVLEELEKQYDIDWVIIDGIDWASKYCEYAMRYQYNFGLTQSGFDWDYWNWRNLYFDGIIDQSMNIAKKGIIGTIYPFVPVLQEKKDKKTKETQQEWTNPPAWRTSLYKEVDNIIRVESEVGTQEGALPRFFLETVSMKRGFVNGIKIDITAEFDSKTKRLNPSQAYERLYEKASLEHYQGES